MLGGQPGDPGDEPGPGEGREAERDADDVADEEFGVLGVDAVREDVQGDAEGSGDDEDLGPVGEVLGARGSGGPEAVDEAVERGGAGGVVEFLVGGEAEGGDGGDDRADEADPGSGFQVDDAAELDGDGADCEAGGAEDAECGESDGAVGAARGEPAESLDPVAGEGEQEGEDGADEGEDLEAAGVAGDGEVAGEFGGPGPGEEGADEGDGRAAWW